MAARQPAAHPRRRTQGSRTFAVLSDHFDEPERLAFSGRIQDHPEAWLPPVRFERLIANLHRAAEICRSEGFEAVLHPHAGTYVETATRSPGSWTG